MDGFNLYYGALKGTPFRWLNIVALAKQLIPEDYQIHTVRYFTAHVSGIADREAPRRQNIYLRALGTLPEVKVHYGSFLAKTVWRPLINLPLADATIAAPVNVTLSAGMHSVAGGSLRRPSVLTVGHYPQKGDRGRRAKDRVQPDPHGVVAEVHTMEEKGSDVNLAAHLLNDAWKGDFDAAVVISNDTDLVTPIQMVAVERRKPVFVVCPGRWEMAPALRRVATFERHIHRSMLMASQFPSLIPGTSISKPDGW